MKNNLQVSAALLAIAFLFGCQTPVETTPVLTPIGPQQITYAPNILPLSQVDFVPKPTERTLPQYPSRLKGSGVTGTVVIVIVVNDAGIVDQAEIQEANDESFGLAVKSALLKWKFSPAIKDGRSVSTYFPLTLSLTDD